MQDKCSSNVGHTLNIAQISSEYTKGGKQVLKRIVEHAAMPEMPQIRKCSVKVFLYNVNVLFKWHVVFDVSLSYPHSVK